VILQGIRNTYRCGMDEAIKMRKASEIERKEKEKQSPKKKK
jgi:hypothetical protein